PRNFPGRKPVASVNSFAAGYDAASRELNVRKTAPFSSWLKPPEDLRAWCVAFKVSAQKAAQKKSPIVKSSGPGYRFSVAKDTTHSVPEASVIATNYTPSEAARGVLEMLGDSEGVFDQLEAGSKLPYCRFNLNYDQDDPAEILLPHLSVIKHLCQILELRVCAELTLGQTDHAFRDSQLMLYLADAFRDEPFVISQLVRAGCLSLALQSLAQGMPQWSEEQLRTFQARFGRFDFCLDVSRTLKAERVWTTTIVDYVHGAPNKVNLIENLFNGPQQRDVGLGAILMTVAPGGWFGIEKLNCSRMIDRYVLPAIDVNARRIDPRSVRAAEQEMSRLSGGALSGLVLHHLFFASMLLPFGGKVAERTALAQTGADCARVACALELYRRENGRLPETLEALQPRFISKLPTDIITGQSLKFRPDGKGSYKLYSVGWNEVDDGGLVASTRPGESSVPPEGDWVWRLP
ncbi:MAG: hypothetical protein ACREIC_05855, partial [Limisphaerales bacterium]